MTKQSTAPSAPLDDTRRAGAILLATSGEATDASGFDPLWASLAGLPLLARSVAAFERTPEIAAIALVVAPDRQPDAEALAVAQDWQRLRIIAATDLHIRSLLRHALSTLSPDVAWIVVHDAARPLVAPELIVAALAAVRALPAAPVAAAASIPVNETLKRVQNRLVVETPPRARLALLQTPQVFSRAALLAALDTPPASPNATAADVASLAVAAGLPIALFPGSLTNIRVASPADLALAETLLNAG